MDLEALFELLRGAGVPEESYADFGTGFNEMTTSLESANAGREEDATLIASLTAANESLTARVEALQASNKALLEAGSIPPGNTVEEDDDDEDPDYHEAKIDDLFAEED